MKAMIFAAGLGIRLKPLTDNKPKALIELGGKTLLERSITYLKSYGISDITVNVHHYAQQIKDYLEQHHYFDLSIHISDESDLLLDTGGGILKAKSLLDGDDHILLMNVDILTNLDLKRFIQFHRESGALASLVVRRRKTSRYLLFDHKNQLSGWENATSGELKVSHPESIAGAIPMAFSGIHLIRKRLFSLIQESGKFSIIDLYLRLSATEKILAFPDSESVWMDLGKYEEMHEAEALIRLIESRRH
jgi:NDP-sugar pyrophosphorylase family protein